MSNRRAKSRLGHWIPELLEIRVLPASSAYVSNELLVRFRKGTTADEQSAVMTKIFADKAEKLLTPAMEQQGILPLYHVHTTGRLKTPAALRYLRRCACVETVEVNYRCRTQVEQIPDDPRYTDGSLWGMYGPDAPAAVGPALTTNSFGTNAESAWASGVTGRHDIVVGVIDEGIQVTHPDLAGNIWNNPFEVPGDGLDNDGNGFVDDIHGWDFLHDDNTVYDSGEDSHGTHVAGTISGEGDNAAGVTGVNWHASIISTKFLGPNGGSISDAIKALDYLTDLKQRHGINIVAVNNSWGGGGYSQFMHEAIIRAARQEILFIAAAGNSSSNNDVTAAYPANYSSLTPTPGEAAADFESVVSVAAINSTGLMATFSSFGAKTVDLGAPGVGIWSTVPDASYASYSGTSMATPHVTGAAALYASYQKGRVSAQSIRAAILDSVTPTASLAGRTLTGGRLNIPAALAHSAFIDFDSQLYAPGQSAKIQLIHSGTNRNPLVAETVVVELRSRTESAPELITLTETGTNTDHFAGSVQLRNGTALRDGILQVSHGDWLQATAPGLSESILALIDAIAPELPQITVTPSTSECVFEFSSVEPVRAQLFIGSTPDSLTADTEFVTATNQIRLIADQLTSRTRYYYRIRISDVAGNTTDTATAYFTTTAPAGILLVDDDEGDNFESIFQDSLTRLNFGFDTWSVSGRGKSPSGPELDLYDTVIWNTGFNHSAATAGLTAAEQSSISYYLDHAGRLFLSGQDVLFKGVASQFRSNYLKLSSYSNDIIRSAHTEIPVAGNPISDGLTLNLVVPAGYGSLYVDSLTPLGDATGIFKYQAANGAYMTSVSYRGDLAQGGFAVVFLTFPFEGVQNSSTAASQVNSSGLATRDVLLWRILDYLDGDGTHDVVVESPASVELAEGGMPVSIGIRLSAPPHFDVTVPISLSNSAAATIGPASLTFTPANWHDAQQVTVTAVNDSRASGDVSLQLQFGAVSSLDPHYSGKTLTPIPVRIIDNDVAGVSRSEPSAITTSEAGDAISLTVQLTSQPDATVVLPVSSSDPTEGKPDRSELVFSAGNWNVPQKVTVTGQPDNLDDGDVVYRLVFGPATSADSKYAGLTPDDLVLTNRHVQLNLPPTIHSVADVRVLPGKNNHFISLSGITAGGTENQPLAVSVTADDVTLIPRVAVSYLSPSSIGDLQFDSAFGKTGITHLDVTVTDGGADSNIGTAGDNRSTALRIEIAIALPVPSISGGPLITSESATPVVSWQGQSGVDHYQISIDDLSTGTTPYLLATVSNTTFQPSTAMPLGKYRVRVRCIQGLATSDWSAAQELRIVTRPIIAAMTPRQVTSDPQVQWDQKSQAHHYDVWVDQVNTGTTQWIRTTSLSGNVLPVSAPWPIGSYRVWVRGVSQDGLASGWSSPVSFAVVPPPVISSPAASTFTTSPEVTWQPVSGAVSYDVFVRNQISGLTTVQASGILGTKYQFPTVASGPYRWWVRAQGQGGIVGTWSSAVDLYVGGLSTLKAGYSATQKSTTFSWTAVEGAQRYELWVSLMPSQTRVIYQTAITATSFTTNALPAGSYRAWVRAVSVTGEIAPWSYPAGFVVL